MKDETKEKEVFWYKLSVDRIEPGDYGRTRFELRIRLEPKDMYAIVKGITDYAIPEELPETLLSKADKIKAFLKQLDQ